MKISVTSVTSVTLHRKKPVITGENACRNFLERVFYVSLSVTKRHENRDRLGSVARMQRDSLDFLCPGKILLEFDGAFQPWVKRGTGPHGPG